MKWKLGLYRGFRVNKKSYLLLHVYVLLCIPTNPFKLPKLESVLGSPFRVGGFWVWCFGKTRLPEIPCILINRPNPKAQARKLSKPKFLSHRSPDIGGLKLKGLNRRNLAILLEHARNPEAST